MVLTNYYTKYPKSIIPNIPNPLYQMSQIHYTKYPQSVIPLIPNPLYHLSQNYYTQYSKYEDNKIE